MAVAEELEGVGLRDVGAFDFALFLGEFEHLFLDFLEVGRSQLVVTRVDVIVETVFDGRADAEFDTGIKLLKRFGEKVCRAVPESVFAFGVIPFEELEAGVFADRTGEIPFLVVDRCCQHVLSQTRAY